VSREKKGDEAHKGEEKESTVLLAETMLSGELQYCQESRIQKVFLNESRVVPKLHLTEGGDQLDRWWYLDNGASNHMTGDL
jgi:hypothetical protein